MQIKWQQGKKIRFFINNETEQHNAVIYQTAKSVDADKTYKVYASVQGVCKNVLPGMYVNAVIEATSNKVAARYLPNVLSVSQTKIIFLFLIEINPKKANLSLNTG